MRVLALLSGGLDSILAVKVIQKEGLEVEGVVFNSLFFWIENAQRAAKELKISLVEIDVSQELLEVIKAPQHGYGRYLNPCIDCHILMLKRAGEVMKKVGASFLITGEVLGERPKSQGRQALKIVEEQSGNTGYLLRPLSARLLEPTVPEKRGWVKRENLLAISGRSRKVQFKLAKEFGIKNYPTPAGGCLLTNPQFSERMKSLWRWRGDLLLEDISLLKLGRHFWFGKSWLVIGRNEKENSLLKEMKKSGDFLIKATSAAGPLGLLRGEGDIEDVKEAALLVVRYGQARGYEEVEVLAEKNSGEKVFKLERKEWSKYL